MRTFLWVMALGAGACVLAFVVWALSTVLAFPEPWATPLHQVTMWVASWPWQPRPR